MTFDIRVKRIGLTYTLFFTTIFFALGQSDLNGVWKECSDTVSYSSYGCKSRGMITFYMDGTITISECWVTIQSKLTKNLLAGSTKVDDSKSKFEMKTLNGTYKVNDDMIEVKFENGTRTYIYIISDGYLKLKRIASNGELIGEEIFMR